MRAAPVLHGGSLLRVSWLVFGLFLCAGGVACFLKAGLGLPPWDVLHQGVAEQLDLNFGVANVIVSMAVLALVWVLRAHIGLGTILNASLIGVFVIGLTAIDVSPQSLAVRIVLLALALPFFGAGSAFYIAAQMGAGPRDSLMLVVSQRLGVRIGFSRTAVELLALVTGFALGGTIGLGTVVFALGIGPAVEASFWLLARTSLASPAVASAPA